jgi:hypothetical protein
MKTTWGSKMNSTFKKSLKITGYIIGTGALAYGGYKLITGLNEAENHAAKISKLIYNGLKDAAQANPTQNAIPKKLLEETGGGIVVQRIHENDIFEIYVTAPHPDSQVIDIGPMRESILKVIVDKDFPDKIFATYGNSAGVTTYPAKDFLNTMHELSDYVRNYEFS